MKVSLKKSFKLGLTRIEVIFLLAGIAVCFFSYLWSSQVRVPLRAQRNTCLNNIKQIGLAFRIYSNDHEERFPWAVPIASTGSLEFALSPQVYRHFLIASNELGSARILKCPNDRKRGQVADWNRLANKNVSYFVGLNARESEPNMLLSGDRNITGGTLSNGFLRTLATNSVAGWTSEIHNDAGNVGFADGSAQQLTSTDLQRHLQSTNISLLAIP